MPSSFVYNKVLRYKVDAELTEPLHVGSAGGDPESILIHPVDGKPFIQSTSLAGAFREAVKRQDPGKAEDLFGSKSAETGSRIVFSDGILTGMNHVTAKETEKNGGIGRAATELRPRVKLDPVTGTVGTETVKGTEGETSGTKFNMQYVGAGAKLDFTAYIFTDGEHAGDDEDFQTALGLLESGGIQLGGQKSNGCGYVKLEHVFFRSFDLTDEKGRSDWMQENEAEVLSGQDVLPSIEKNADRIPSLYAYKITVSGRTEGSLLVKALAVPDVGEDAPDAQNIQNAKKDYIIPGSSFKGAVKAEMKQIADYLQKNTGLRGEILLEDAFGTVKNGTRDGSTGHMGNLRFKDTVAGDKEWNDRAPLHHRIHIDKFTGGVINGGLFSTKDVCGDVKFEIGILDQNEPEKTLGLLLLALRNLSAGHFNLGSGYNVGKGFVTVDTIQIEDMNGDDENNIFVLDIKNRKADGDVGILNNAFASLKGKGAAE